MLVASREINTRGIDDAAYMDRSACCGGIGESAWRGSTEIQVNTGR